MGKSATRCAAIGITILTCLVILYSQLLNSTSSAEDSKTNLDSKFAAYVPKLLKIAADYRRWGRVDDEVRWAPELCRVPKPAQTRFSKSSDTDSHGEKLYSLFALDRSAYLGLWLKPEEFSHWNDRKKSKDATSNDFQQVIVKESWKPIVAENIKRDPFGRFPTVESDKPSTTNDPKEAPTPLDSFSPYAERDGKIYRADKPSGLFVMMQLAKSTSDSDAGWIYGTVSSDGKTVTSIGLTKSCMECHREAPHGRLFGIDYHGR